MDDWYYTTPWSWVLARRYNNPTKKVADEHYLAFGDPVPPWSSDYLMRIADPHLGHLNELQSQPQPARGLVLLQHSQRSQPPGNGAYARVSKRTPAHTLTDSPLPITCHFLQRLQRLQLLSSPKHRWSSTQQSFTTHSENSNSGSRRKPTCALDWRVDITQVSSTLFNHPPCVRSHHTIPSSSCRSHHTHTHTSTTPPQKTKLTPTHFPPPPTPPHSDLAQRHQTTHHRICIRSYPHLRIPTEAPKRIAHQGRHTGRADSRVGETCK